MPHRALPSRRAKLRSSRAECNLTPSSRGIPIAKNPARGATIAGRRQLLQAAVSADADGERDGEQRRTDNPNSPAVLHLGFVARIMAPQ